MFFVRFQDWDIAGIWPCRSKQIFGVQRIFAQISPKSCRAASAYKFSPTKIMNTFFWCALWKRFSFVFLQTFWSQTTLGAIFTKISGILPSYSEIFKDFAQIFNNSKLLGVLLYHLHLRHLHHIGLQCTCALNN